MKIPVRQSDDLPDWEKIPEAERTPLQRLAARTNGWVTPGNILSAAGGLLVAKGLYDFSHGKRLQGTLVFGAGRVLDLVDGAVADKTKTKSPKGAKVDAVIDQAGLALALPVMRSAGVITTRETVGLATEWAVSAISSAYATANGVELKTGWAGKRSTFWKWAGIGVGCLTATAESLGAEKGIATAETVGHLALDAGIALGARASAEYMRDSGLLTATVQAMPTIYV